MTIEWIDAGAPQGGVWSDWLNRTSPLLASRLGPHPADWLGLSAAGAAGATPPPNLAWLKAFPPAEKSALAGRLTTALQREFGAALPGPLTEALGTLGQPNAALIITGQQPGLWGGPCYTLWKALSAAVAAKRLNDPATRPAWAAEFQFVPAFWVAGEDADVAEAARAWSWSAAGGVKAFHLGENPAFGSAPHAALNDIALGPAAAAFAECIAALDATEHTAAVTELLNAYSDPAQTICRAFVRLLIRVLGELGMVVIESRMLAGQPARDGLALRGITEQAAIAEALNAGAATLTAAQYEVGFPPATVERGPFVFLSDAGKNVGDRLGARRRLIGAQAPFSLHHLEGSLLTTNALSDLLRSAPERFSFGAPLRVLVQNLSLPTAAVVLGPGELAYWAQLRELSDTLNVPWPALLPRLSATALLSRHSRVLRKFNVALDPFLTEKFDPNRVVPPPADLQPWLAQQHTVLAGIKAWFEQGGALAKSEQKLQEKTAQKLEYEIDKFAGRVTRAHAESLTGESSSVQALRDFVHIHGGPQERALVWPVLLNARGIDLPAQWLDEFQTWLADGANLTKHAVLHL